MGSKPTAKPLISEIMISYALDTVQPVYFVVADAVNPASAGFAS